MANDYSENTPKYKAIQWTGSNETDVQALIQSVCSHQFVDTDWTLANKQLSVYWSPDGYSRYTVRTGDPTTWLVFGPYWGTDPTVYWTLDGPSPWKVLVDAQATARLTAV